jgi:hypothetical protein
MPSYTPACTYRLRHVHPIFTNHSRACQPCRTTAVGSVEAASTQHVAGFFLQGICTHH